MALRGATAGNRSTTSQGLRLAELRIFSLTSIGNRREWLSSQAATESPSHVLVATGRPVAGDHPTSRVPIGALAQRRKGVGRTITLALSRPIRRCRGLARSGSIGSSPSAQRGRTALLGRVPSTIPRNTRTCCVDSGSSSPFSTSADDSLNSTFSKDPTKPWAATTRKIRGLCPGGVMPAAAGV